MCGMKSKTSKHSDLGRIRDTVESVYIAIVLAFVLRAFMVEAFVIPTGSMANSLYGEHYELECPSCFYNYAHGWNPDIYRRTSQATIPTQASCPNCSYFYQWADEPERVFMRGGDRVLVLKYIYDFAGPKPWDVVVFKNPQNNRENFIKRLIGLPGEMIEIVRGDVFYSTDDGASWQIRRKPASAQESMWQNVFTNDNPPNIQMLAAEGITAPGWRYDAAAGQDESWDLSGFGGRVIAFKGSEVARKVSFDPGANAFRPTNGYNAPNVERAKTDMENDICTDWKLSAVFMSGKTSGSQIALTFVSFGDRFRAEFNDDGKVRLAYQKRDKNPDKPTEWVIWGEKNVGNFKLGKGRKIALSVVDFQATLWVDGKTVLQSTDEQFDSGYKKAIDRATLGDRLEQSETNKLTARKKLLEKQWKDYQNPEVAIFAKGQPMELWHIKLQRDVYYTSPSLRLPGVEEYKQRREFDYLFQMQNEPTGPAGRNSWKKGHGNDYLAWGVMGNPIKLRKNPETPDLDEYFCMGDNSPLSHDGRSWLGAAPSLRLYDDEKNYQYQIGTVPRYNILGRALFVYWPAGFRLPVLDWPLVPNVGRMRFIK